MEMGQSWKHLAVAAALSLFATAVHGGLDDLNPTNPSGLEGSGDLKVLFIGNSITLHAATPSLGWTNSCGMAASAPENDYVHRVARGLEDLTGRATTIMTRNVADFERNYASWEPAAHLATEAAFAPEFLVVAIGENVRAFPDDEARAAFRAAFAGLLGLFLDGRADAPKTVVRGVFWPNGDKDAVMASVAEDFGAAFVAADLGDVSGMQAGIDRFAHEGVARHPGDEGMAAIARHILVKFRELYAISPNVSAPDWRDAAWSPLGMSTDTSLFFLDTRPAAMIDATPVSLDTRSGTLLASHPGNLHAVPWGFSEVILR